MTKFSTQNMVRVTSNIAVLYGSTNVALIKALDKLFLIQRQAKKTAKRFFKLQKKSFHKLSYTQLSILIPTLTTAAETHIL